jgi:hypothetical protein
MVENSRAISAEFEHLFSSKETISLSTESKSIDTETRFISMQFDPETLDSLIKKCKKVGAKLTGCLNMIGCMATYDMYKTLYYHYLVNLRQFYSIDNLTMGYWPVVLNGVFNTDELLKPDYDFWSLVKKESDLIHERLRCKEHLETAKLDLILLDLIDKQFVFDQGGGVHFALSNSGIFTTSSNTKRLKIKELYYNVAVKSNRWSTILFHGVVTIDSRLCWSVGWNWSSIKKENIEFLCDAIKRHVYEIIQD